MATGTITDKINNVVALLIDQCNCETPSEIKACPCRKLNPNILMV